MNALDDIVASFSRYGQRAVEPSPVSRMMAAFAEDFRDGVDINLGVGYVNEKTMPTDALREAVAYVLSHPEEHRQPMNYGGPAGSPQLIAALRRMLSPRIPSEVLSERVIHIGASGTTSLLAALTQIFEPGSVITADSMYYIYTNTLERAGFDVATVSENEDGMDPDALADALNRADNVRFVYVVTVNNPSCSILSDERRLRIVDVVKAYSDRVGKPVPVFFDGAYEGLIHDPGCGTPASAMSGDDGGLVYELGTLSKIFAPALRIGYVVGPSGPLMDAMIQYTNDVGFSAPLLMQEVAARLVDHQLESQRANVCRGYREKAKRVLEAIDEHLGPHLEAIEGGRAGFYYYLTFREIETHEASSFFELVAHNTHGPRVVYVPGCHFVHERGPIAEKGNRQLRLSYGYEETDRIVEAIAIMGEAARNMLESGDFM